MKIVQIKRIEKQLSIKELFYESSEARVSAIRQLIREYHYEMPFAMKPYRLFFDGYGKFLRAEYGGKVIDRDEIIKILEQVVPDDFEVTV